MCGIGGVAARRAELPDTPFLADALTHRGPEGDNSLERAGEGWSWRLVHTRLSINDLSPAGEEPMSNEDGSLWLIFNGEIYNSPELRALCESKGHFFRSRMDGEVILHLWEDEGAACLERLNGVFAFALADAATGEITLVRDPLGVKPLFFAVERGVLWFASELKALQAAAAPVGRPDVKALARYLTFLWIPSPDTPFEDAHSLPPAHVMTWRGDDPVSRRYRPAFHPVEDAPPISLGGAVNELQDRFQAATSRQLLADVPIGLMASGGIDSGLIWWATQKRIDSAFSISWPSGRDAEGLADDATATRLLGERFGTSVEFLDGTDADDGSPPRSGDLFADPAFDLTRLIARSARRRGLKVLLSGQGGDELFAGYRRHRVAAMLGNVRLGPVGRVAEFLTRALPASRLMFEYAHRVAGATAKDSPFDAYMHLCTYSSARDRARILGCTEFEVSDEVVWAQHREAFEGFSPRLSLLRRVLALDLNVYLPGLGLAYVDRGGMESGVEIRVPWLDLELVEWSLTLPDEVLMRRGKGKLLPRALAGQLLGHSFAARPKRPFAAPMERVGTPTAGAFRQGRYLARAEAILQGFLERSAA